MREFEDSANHEEQVTKNDDLLTLLHKSSHFLHHRRGGKRGQGKILTLLAEHPEISQKELQELLGIESGSMSELVIKLEQKGLITRTKDEADKRMARLMITDLGLEVSKEIEARDGEEDKLLADFLTTQEQEQLKELLSKLLKGWEEHHGALRMERGCRRGRGPRGCHDKHHDCRGHHRHQGHHEHQGHHGHEGRHEHQGHHEHEGRHEYDEYHTEHGDHVSKDYDYPGHRKTGENREDHEHHRRHYHKDSSKFKSSQI